MTIVGKILCEVRDLTAYGQELHRFPLLLEKPLLSVAALIDRRIQAEVERYNRRGEAYFHGLVQPVGARVCGGAFKLRPRRRIRAGQQVDAALAAFLAGRFYLLVDGYRPQALDEEVLMNDDDELCFVKVSPVIGG